MEYINKLVKSAIASVLAAAAANAIAAPVTAITDQNLEKCYGVAKAGQNDCQTSTHSCAGTVMKDRQLDAFVLVPKGTCEKLAGGTTSMNSNSTAQK
jgi:uncharacterized membrane protein